MALSSEDGWDYDVFISFRGTDTGKGFAGNLYYALKQRGIRTYYADNELERGEELEPTLLKRIQDSKMAITVFSKGYAESAFCLLELAAIMECINARGRLVFPVFYDVSASEVRYQKTNKEEGGGTYEAAMTKHEEKKGHETVKKWREALKKAASLSGMSFKSGNVYEYKFIGEIIEVVSKNVNRTLLWVAKHPVGLETPVTEVCKLLDVGPGCDNGGVRMVGINGISGIGKSTLAKAVFNYIADQFENRCFLENVRENSSKHGLEHLQEKLLFDTVGERNIKFVGTSQGAIQIESRLSKKKILLVLDDVDKEDQLAALAGGTHWFGSGSRVIITTQERQVLRKRGIERNHELNGLDWKDACKLFEWKLNKKADPRFDDVIDRAVNFCAKLPLALEIMSSDLGTMDADTWESALGYYERNLSTEIHDILKRSFDRLTKEVQNVFLDIACCLKGLSSTEVNNMLSAHYGFPIKYQIELLVDKSLVKVGPNNMLSAHGFPTKYQSELLVDESLIKVEHNVVELHDKIQDMGRIIEQEGKHGRRFLLSSCEAIVQLFEDRGFVSMKVLNIDDAECIKAIHGLSSAPNLEELSFSNCVSLTKIDESVGKLRKLKILNGEGCCELRSFPSVLLPSLEKLNLSSCSSLENFPEILGKMEKLAEIDVSYTNIIAMPDLSSFPNLEELSFSKCENLFEIDKSVGLLGKLRLLNASGCCNLESFPSLLLPLLEELDLSWCSSLQKFPDILGKMEKITRLTLHYTSIKELPNSIQNLTRLQTLEMLECGILQLPTNITLLPELRDISFYRTPNEHEAEEKLCWMKSSDNTIYASQCTITDGIFSQVFPWFAMYLEELDLFHVNFTSLPYYTTECELLKELNLDQCHNLQKIRWLPPNLEKLSVTCCRSLEDLDLTILPGSSKEYYNFRRLIVDNCENLRNIKGIPPKGFSATNCLSLPSSDISMLLNQELRDEGGNMWRFVPAGSENSIGEWFHPWNDGNSSVSFWFRNKFPAISLCVFLGALGKRHIAFYFCPKLEINGNSVNKWLIENKKYWFVQEPEADHIFILHEKYMKYENSVNEEALVRNKEWNHAKIFVDVYSPRGWTEIDMRIGIHIFEGKNSMKDVRFTDPYNNVTEKSNSVDSTQTSGTSIVKVNLKRISHNYSRKF
ncbi:hypothetical protein PIB30_074853 [Stylosanthes scabra]|uniref:TIR domain-containing protein n=1 Tax=Stylosanthes scabra TaxID=79078 RepID=A0ABU6UTH7_9FABA|nr:hypothetical protein [Stylosanthes scabra]